MHRLTICWALACVLGCTATSAYAQPKPSVTPESWELTYRPGEPMRIEVDAGSGPQVYWYMLYTVVNETGQDVNFHPEITRVSEIENETPTAQAVANPKTAPKLISEISIVPHPKVFEAIKKRHEKTYPFLVSPIQAIGKLRQGKDYAITSVAIFKELDPRVSKFTIYVSGLSGEMQTIANPKYDSKKPDKADQGENDDNPQFFVLRKTLAMPYTIPGDIKTSRYAKPALGKLAWVMR